MSILSISVLCILLVSFTNKDQGKAKEEIKKFQRSFSLIPSGTLGYGNKKTTILGII